MRFMTQLEQAWTERNSLVCVGLDSAMDRLPRHFAQEPESILLFNREIIDATADLVCAYKPQIAYYAAVAAEDQLQRTIRYIHENHPGVPVILDAKRGDIGSTAEMYAREAFDRYEADAVTVNPYMGGDSMEPFFKRKDKGIALLCKTSNQGGRDLQDLTVGDKKLYQIVAQKAATEWNIHENLLLVVGATFPEELAMVRSIVGAMPLLVPGIGAQSGDVERAVRNGKDARGTGMIVNSSRAILYASDRKDFAEAGRKATLDLRDSINRYR